MDIKVLRKSESIFVKPNTVEINFKKFKGKEGSRKIPTIVAYATQGDFIQVRINLLHINSRVPATLLARWINLNYPHKLLTLIDRCNTVGYEFDSKHSKHNKWFFRNKENTVFGLHKIKKRVDSVLTRSVVIDDSLSMQDVKNILNMLDIEVECEYDVSKQRMLKITLKGDL